MSSRATRRSSPQAASEDCSALLFASDELKGDREIFFHAISDEGRALALALASDELKGDKEVVLQAVSENWEALALVAPYSRDTAILSLRYPISRDTFSGRLALPQNGAIPPFST